MNPIEGESRPLPKSSPFIPGEGYAIEALGKKNPPKGPNEIARALSHNDPNKVREFSEDEYR